MKRVDVTSLKSPRPFPIKLFNSIGFNTKLDKDSLLKAARKRTKLHGYGNESFIEPLELLLNSINEEAQLHKFGRFITKERLVNILQNRLRAEALFKQHPEIVEEETKPPIIIAGLQRTGTTKLHRLLAIHPQLRALTSWEALNPAPMINDVDNRKRIKQSKTAEQALRYMSPQFFAIHPVEHEAPEEDILLNDMAFISTVPEATMHVPSYAKWAETTDHTPAYEYMIKMLQLLQWQRKSSNKTWVLKTPQNMEFLDLLYKLFPNARIIHTYRDPLKTIASFSSMVYQSRRIFSDAVDPERCARHWLRKDQFMIDRSMQLWQEQAHDHQMDISYYDLVQDSKSVLRAILEFCGLEYTDEYDQKVSEALNVNRQHKYGKHHYKLEDFGLSSEEVDNTFTAYRQKFNIPYE